MQRLIILAKFSSFKRAFQQILNIFNWEYYQKVFQWNWHIIHPTSQNFIIIIKINYFINF